MIPLIHQDSRRENCEVLKKMFREISQKRTHVFIIPWAITIKISHHFSLHSSHVIPILNFSPETFFMNIWFSPTICSNPINPKCPNPRKWMVYVYLRLRVLKKKYIYIDTNPYTYHHISHDGSVCHFCGNIVKFTINKNPSFVSINLRSVTIIIYRIYNQNVQNQNALLTIYH